MTDLQFSIDARNASILISDLSTIQDVLRFHPDRTTEVEAIEAKKKAIADLFVDTYGKLFKAARFDEPDLSGSTNEA